MVKGFGVVIKSCIVKRRWVGIWVFSGGEVKGLKSV